MHGALKDWLCLGVRGAENADMSPGTILVKTAETGRNQLGEVFDGQFQLHNVMQNRLADPGECFLHELQGAFKGCVAVAALGAVVVVFVVAIVLTLLASEVVEDFLELVALLLELGLDFADEGVKTSLVGVQACLELAGDRGGGVASMTSSSWIVIDWDL